MLPEPITENERGDWKNQVPKCRMLNGCSTGTPGANWQNCANNLACQIAGRRLTGLLRCCGLRFNLRRRLEQLLSGRLAGDAQSRIPLRIPLSQALLPDL